MKINEVEAESIFAYAEALEKSGRQKNSIFISGRTVYILNYDKTVLLRFSLSKEMTKGTEFLAFFGSDYESSKFEIDHDLVGFKIDSTSGEWTRTTTCKIPNQTFGDVDDLFKKLYDAPVINKHQIIGAAIIDNGVLDLLKENLSHIEFFVRNKELYLIQRDIYSGSISEIKRKNREGLGLIEEPYEFSGDPAPLGIRTNDFIALFSFTDKVTFQFLPEEFGYFLVKAPHSGLTGVIGGCLYNSCGELNYIQKENENGRQKSQNRSIQPKINRPTQGSKRPRLLWRSK